MIKSSHTSWISDHPDKLPDFIIGGAMKSGTTSLHSILNNHPDIGIAHEELGFFDIDNTDQHPDFKFFDTHLDKWITQDLEQDPERFWNWYYSKFPEGDYTLIGEDSTTYLASPIAAERISMQKKPIKLIFILRHPTYRTISNYTHNLKSGRAIYNLEDTLRIEPNTIIKRSLYKEQLEQYYKVLPSEQIKVILFEDFISDTEPVIKELCNFIGVEFKKYKKEDLEVHANKTKTSKSEVLQRKRNKMLRYFGNYRYAKFLPNIPTQQGKIPFAHRLINKVHNMINPKSFQNKIKVKPETIHHLNDFFKKEMEGIDALVKKEISSKWFG